MKPLYLHEKESWFERNPKKTFAVLFLSLLIILIVFVFLVEKVLDYRELKKRVYSTRYIRLKEFPPFWETTATPAGDYIEATAADSLALKKYRMRIDENGFIIPSKKHEKPDFTIVFLGGSTTECLFVDEQKRFPYLVGVMLEKEKKIKINSYNSGVSGNNSLHALNILINKAIPLNPDVVVAMHTINDLITLLYEKSYWNDNPFRSPLVTAAPKKATLKNFFLPNIYGSIRALSGKSELEDEFAHLRGTQLTVNKERMLKEYEKNLQNIVDVCKARNIEPVLMTMPSRFRKDNVEKPVLRYMKSLLDFNITYEQFRDLFESFNQSVRDVGNRNDIMVIDLEKDVPQDRQYIYDAVHFNDVGSEFASKIISSSLITFVNKKTGG